MYGSAGTHSAGSIFRDVFTSATRSIGIGLGSGEPSPEYDFLVESIAAGFGVSNTDFILQIQVESIAAGLGIGVPEDPVLGTIEIGVNSIGIGIAAGDLSRDIFVAGIPAFVVSRTSTTADIQIFNRDGRDVAIYRADVGTTEQTLRGNYELIEIISTDSYEDTGLTASTRYKYKLAFAIDLEPPIIGRPDAQYPL